MRYRRHLRTRLMQGLLIIAILSEMPLLALEEATHVIANQQAVASWTYLENGTSKNRLDQILSAVLGYRAGRNTTLLGKPVQDWIDMGGTLDEGSPAAPKTGRYFNHFHDPLRPWSLAGLWSLNPFLGQNESAVRWMQNRDQTVSGLAGGRWSWHDARHMYYRSLTVPDPRMREALLAATFRSPGQMMHLVVDASNPDHSRNDGHPLASAENLGYWNYDKWILSRHTGTNDGNPSVQNLLANPIGFDPSILDIPISDSEPANVPIARLIDSDLYNGGDPWVTFNADDSRLPVRIGLAEISNANFFSEDTLEAGYANPPQSTAGLIPIEMPGPQPARDGRNVVRRYWTRPPGLGLLPANPLRAQCAADAFFARGQLVKPKPYWCMDGVVWDQTASHMLPRAAGYARGVLEYFFRGELAVQRVFWDATGIKITLQNKTDETMEGVFDIYLRHDPDTEGERREKAGSINGGATTTIAPNASITLPLTLLTTAAGSSSAVLVFRGKLGLEQDAVATQIFSVPNVEIVVKSNKADVVSDCGFLADYKECHWRPTNIDVSGDIQTTSQAPTVARIDAAWSITDRPQQPVLELDGVAYPNGWQRVGTEPDPKAFRIRLPNQFRGYGFIGLTVTLTNGQQVSETLPNIFWAKSSVLKRVSSYKSTGLFRILMEKKFDVRTTFPQFPQKYQTLEIGGYGPTNTIHELEQIADEPRVLEVLSVTNSSYFEAIVHAHAIVAEHEIASVWEPLPPAILPTFLWSMSAQRSYHNHERALLQTFSLNGAQPYTVSFEGRAVCLQGPSSCQ